MEHDCCEHPLPFDLDALSTTLESWGFPFNRDEHRLSMTLPGKNGDLNFHINVMNDGQGKPCMLRLLSYSPSWSPIKAGLDRHALLHYMNHRNAAAIMGRHFVDENTGKAAFEITVYSSYGVFEKDLQDLIWFTVHEADETISHLADLARIPSDVH